MLMTKKKHAKDQPNKGLTAAQKRWGMMTREVLKKRKEEVDELAQMVHECVTATEIFGFEAEEEFRVDSATQWERGMAMLRNCIEQIHIGIVLHKRDKSRGSRWQSSPEEGESE